MVPASTFIYSFEETCAFAFNFESTVQVHGWVALPPFAWHPETAMLSRVHRLANGQVVSLSMQAVNNQQFATIKIEVESTAATLFGSPQAGRTKADVETVNQVTAEEQEIRQVVQRMLRLDEDLSEFHQLAAQMNGWKLPLKPGSGRLLRCPSLFEDIVYTLCTTNIAWSGTIRMVTRLTTELGQPFPGREDWLTFPNPESIAAAGVEFLQQKTGLGYRSAYVWQLAKNVAEGRLNLADFEDPNIPTAELHKALRQIKGVGPYAAATILMLLGRYEHLAVDSEMRAFVSRNHFANQPVSEAQIRSIYAPWGRWQYLAYWFDLITEA